MMVNEMTMNLDIFDLLMENIIMSNLDSAITIMYSKDEWQKCEVYLNYVVTTRAKGVL